jgi:hypothetical protein
MIKFSFVFILISFSFHLMAQKKYKIDCINRDCFQFGWTMQEVNGKYRLKNQCIQKDCKKYGWASVDSNKNRFIVRCKKDGCFNQGWHSVNYHNGKVLYDQAACKRNNCLRFGWKVKTGYDLSGGNVTCRFLDCSKFGGFAHWRGKTSKTYCQDYDCYGKGWFLEVNQ